MLIVARVLMGVGTSVGYPSTMVLIRRRATEAALTRPGGCSAGSRPPARPQPPSTPLLGGLLVGAVGWHWAVLVNIPVTVIALAMALRWVPKDPLPARGEHAEGHGFRTIAQRIDLAGILGFAPTTTH
jgi:MFS family permease